MKKKNRNFYKTMFLIIIIIIPIESLNEYEYVHLLK